MGTISRNLRRRVTRMSGACHHQKVNFGAAFLIGIFLGFVFGVGCALAVMYSIFLGGYRAALRDCQLPSPPERLAKARAKLTTFKLP